MDNYQEDRCATLGGSGAYPQDQCEKVREPRAYTDGRFATIQDKARELRGLARELNEMSHHKFGELLGNHPTSDCAKTAVKPGCWADHVIMEQDEAIETIKNTLDRIGSV